MNMGQMNIETPCVMELNAQLICRNIESHPCDASIKFQINKLWETWNQLASE